MTEPRTQAELDLRISAAVREKRFPDLRVALNEMKTHYPKRYRVWREALLLAVEAGKARVAMEKELKNAADVPADPES